MSEEGGVEEVGAGCEEGAAALPPTGCTQSDSETSEQPPAAPPKPVLAPKPEAPKTEKIEILLKATGGVSIVVKKKWFVDRSRNIGFVTDFLRKYLLRCGNEMSIFLYVNQTFAPSPDVPIDTLYKCFGANGRLVLHYCQTQAWG